MFLSFSTVCDEITSGDFELFLSAWIENSKSLLVTNFNAAKITFEYLASVWVFS